MSNPNFAKFLSTKERASLRCTDTACKNIELIPRDKIQELCEKHHKTVTAENPTYSANSVTLWNIIGDRICSDIEEMIESEGRTLSDNARTNWIYPLIRKIQNEHVERPNHAVIPSPDC